MRVWAASHVGRQRESNEDRVVVGPWILAPDRDDIATIELRDPPFVVAVLDGMGGQAAGTVAATLTAEVVASQGDSVEDETSAAYLTQWANRAIYDRMEEAPELSGMGTTIVGVALVEDRVVLFNVGDTRAYVETDGYLIQLSVDDAAPNGALTQCLGGLRAYRPVEAHVAVEPHRDRRFLLATDGLFGHLDDQTLEACLASDDESTVRRLLDAALDGGGPDNVSIVIIRFDGDLPTDDAGR